MGKLLNPGRLAAGYVLLAVMEGQHADSEMERQAELDRQRRLSPADRGLAWHLVQGVLRHRGELDAALDTLSNRPVDDLDLPVQAALRIGAFELRHSRVPPHAAVDQAVQLVVKLKGGRAKGLVNAVLRRVGKVELKPDPTRNHPDWLVSRWRLRFGPKETDAWCARNDAQAPLSVACQGDVAALQSAIAEQVESVAPAVLNGVTLANALVIRGLKGPVTALPGFEEGQWWVMDPAAIATADLLEAKAGERVLDACAAPGGKSFRLASQGALVTCVDRARTRLARLQANAKRLGLSVSITEFDWIEHSDFQAGEFDAVLVDAPCTGLGTLRRHPEIRWRSMPSDPLAMGLTQGPLLAAAAQTLRPGGRLVYAVCSPEPEEGQQVVDTFLKAHPDFVLDRVLDCAPPQGDEDAFYAARLFRKAKEPIK
jgi:16S rRNA (cytosine967-C5)-methyltransferase